MAVSASLGYAGPPPTTTAAAPLQPCAAAVAAMPLRARLAQRLMVGVSPTDPAEALAVVRSEQVGGIFIGGNGTSLLGHDALAPVQTAAKVPVAVAVDEEGGRVQRIDTLDGSIPSARAMAATMTAAQVRALAAKRGAELRSHGVTVDLAPDVDLGGQPANAVIGDRSYSTDPAVVVRYAAAFASGLRDGGVLPVLKHFPGHGRANGDSHQGPVTTPPLADLEATDLQPYRGLLSDGSLGIMVGHLTVPGLTAGKPATISPAAYQLLRHDYGFGGLVITDDLGAMRAITASLDLPAAVLAALRSGADIALWSSGGRTATVLDRLQAAVASGELAGPAVDEEAARVLAAKGVCIPSVG